MYINIRRPPQNTPAKMLNVKTPGQTARAGRRLAPLPQAVILFTLQNKNKEKSKVSKNCKPAAQICKKFLPPCIICGAGSIIAT
ncbi:MAG: hypothetical protein Q4C86_08225 [bacterium]|nr:hypothetical protein [bacterium]